MQLPVASRRIFDVSSVVAKYFRRCRAGNLRPRYALLIHPGGVESPPSADRLIDISIALLDYAEVDDFKASCRIKYCVEYDDERLALGLQFVTIDFQSVQHLDRFVEKHRPLI